MLKKSRLFIGSLAIAAGLAGFSTPVYAASVPCLTSTTASAATGCHKDFHKCGHHGFGTMELLSEISGKSVTEIASLYPQKTSWQAAKAMGKLDDLKKAYLSRARVAIDRLVEDKRVSAQDGAKMYADVQKRVAAIDGVNIVITGRPNFKPQFQSGAH